MADGPIKTLLDTKPREEWAALKSQSYADAFPTGGAEWDVGDRHFSVTNIVNHGKKVIMNIEATEGGVPLVLINPFIFHNPPILVPDGTTSTWLDVGGSEYLVNNFKEDVAGALKLIVEEAVRVAAIAR